MIAPLLAYVRRHHLAMLALMVALGGTAYAADKLRSRDVANGSLKSKDLGNKALLGRDIQPGALKGRHIDESTLETDVDSTSVVSGDDGIEVQNADGFSRAYRVDTGAYVVVARSDLSACNFATTLLYDDSTPAASAQIGGVSGEVATVIVRQAGGQPVDIGGPSGLKGFSLVAAC